MIDNNFCKLKRLAQALSSAQVVEPLDPRRCCHLGTAGVEPTPLGNRAGTKLVVVGRKEGNDEMSPSESSKVDA